MKYRPLFPPMKFSGVLWCLTSTNTLPNFKAKSGGIHTNREIGLLAGIMLHDVCALGVIFFFGYFLALSSVLNASRRFPIFLFLFFFPSPEGVVAIL